MPHPPGYFLQILISFFSANQPINYSPFYCFFPNVYFILDLISGYTPASHSKSKALSNEISPLKSWKKKRNQQIGRDPLEKASHLRVLPTAEVSGTNRKGKDKYKVRQGRAEEKHGRGFKLMNVGD